MAKSYKDKRISFPNFLCSMNIDDDEYNLNPNSARICYNTKTKNGALIQGNGFEEVVLPAHRTIPSRTRKLTYSDEYDIKKIWKYNSFSERNSMEDYELVGFGTDNKIYFLNLFINVRRFQPLFDYVFNEEPTALSFRVNDRDVIAFVSPQDPMHVWYCDDSPYKVESAPKLLSICYHNNRLFAIDKENTNLVRYSSKRNPLDWSNSQLETGGGSIEINDYKGQLKNLISLADNLYIFRDFGISRISTYTSKLNYNAVNIYTSSCKIYCSTACLCGSEVYFLAEDGLYSFDGFNVKNVGVKFKTLIYGVNQNNAKTCYHNGNLYIACNLNFNDNQKIGVEQEEGYINNALIEFDTQTHEYNISRGIDINFMLPIKDLHVSKLVICMNGSSAKKLWQLTDNGKLETLILQKKWQGGKINFNSFDNEKILKEVNLVCRKDCYLKVNSECGKKTVLIKASDKMQRVRINLKGKNIEISFESEFEDMYILSPQFVFNVEV